MTACFGPAGNPDAFYAAGFRASADMPRWLVQQNLQAYEYQCSRGATVREDTARLIGQRAAECGILLSIHAPYYISLATEDETISANTVNHFVKSLQAARWLGADRIVFHMGGPGKASRSAALERVKALFAVVLNERARMGCEDICLQPETMGKQNQLGSCLEEVLDLCAMAPQVRPAVDFGHLHAVTGGGYTTEEEFAAVFDRVGEALGAEAARYLHIHFSRIEYTRAGEKRHWTLADPYGPPHEPLMAVIAEGRYTPRVICESAGTQALDACQMQEVYRRLLNEC